MLAIFFSTYWKRPRWPKLDSWESTHKSVERNKRSKEREWQYGMPYAPTWHSSQLSYCNWSSATCHFYKIELPIYKWQMAVPSLCHQGTPVFKFRQHLRETEGERWASELACVCVSCLFLRCCVMVVTPFPAQVCFHFFFFFFGNANLWKSFWEN